MEVLVLSVLLRVLLPLFILPMLGDNHIIGGEADVQAAIERANSSLQSLHRDIALIIRASGEEQEALSERLVSLTELSTHSADLYF